MWISDIEHSVSIVDSERGLLAAVRRVIRSIEGAKIRIRYREIAPGPHARAGGRHS